MSERAAVGRSGSDELERLRAENMALNEQVKLLVQTEQRLYRTQNARERELRRIQAIGAFALDVVTASKDRVFERTLEVLHACFSLDDAVVVHVDGDPLARVCSGDRSDTIALPAGVPPMLRDLSAAMTMELEAPGDGAVTSLTGLALELLRAIGLPTTGWCTLLPLGGGAVAVAVSVVRRRPVYREDPLTAQHLPLLQLIGTHVERVVGNMLLNEDLRRRTQTLVEVNERLAESLRTVERTQDELVQAGRMEAMGRLAGGVAHDFNNLLTVILNHAALAVETLPPEAPEAGDLEQVLQASRRAAEITSQLLALGRKTVQKRRNIDLGIVARDLGRVLKGLLGRAVALEVESEPGCVICADQSQIEQVILNLVINARDAMPQGGTVRVAVRGARGDDVASDDPASRQQPMVALEVEDTGIGMDAETCARIFEPFFTTKAEGRGTGLGLAVVYGVVTQSEGFVTVYSQAGKGTRFVVTLPRRVQPADSPRAAAAPAAVGARVLLVEDSEAIRNIAARILSRAGYQVQEACDGVEALERVAGRQRDFDLVLTDLNMPRMTGFELAQQLRTVMPGARVLFMTGYSEELADVSRRAPDIACMTKPFTPAQLLEHVSRQLVGAGAAGKDGGGDPAGPRGVAERGT